MRARRHASILAATTFLLLVCQATPAAAREGDWEVNPVLDVLLWRPVGLIFTGVGAVSWLIAAPINLIRGVEWDHPGLDPEPLDRASKHLVLGPVYFTFVDPLGRHPCRDSIHRC